MDRFAVRGLRTWLRRRVAEFPDRATPATGAPEARVVGMSPRRVLVLGSGIAVGWGSSSHDAAFTGALGRAFHDLDGRGVIVDNRAVTLETIWTTLRRLGAVGAVTFDVVVWSPCLCDLVHSPARGRYRRALLALLDRINETAPSGCVVVAGIPEVTGDGRFEEIARRAAPRFNRALRDFASGRRRTVVVPPPAVDRLLDPTSSDAGFYDRWAEQIVQAVQTPLPVR